METSQSTVQTKPLLEVRALSKSYPTARGMLHVLADVNLAVQEGELVSVLGPSGCGKSTLLRIIAGLEAATQGSVQFSAQGQGAHDDGRLGRIAYMPQKDLLLPWRTTLGNAVLGLEVQGVPASEARRRALVLLDAFGLAGFADEYPHNLSGGMRQRVAFLRTILADKPLVLLDEPFGALDALTRTDMQDWLLQLWSGLGRTALLVTHDVEEALLLSHRVYLLSPRPGTVTHLLPVPLSWPRTRQVAVTEEFTKLKAQVLDLLRQSGAASPAQPLRDGPGRG
ncbi:MAG: ABC transporter ATP-binding protein [Dehalococcoidia bacterium]|nr:ABC transporter ATP-binding protein [Dehalococcoidia bacterium]